MYVKLSDYAKRFGVTYRTAWNRYHADKIPNCTIDETGHILIPMSNFNIGNNKRAIIYARVSSHEMKENLNRQMDRVREYTIKNGFNIINEISEIGSGMNDHRTKLIKLLNKINDWDVIVVENKDRLTRFGFHYIKTILNQFGKDIIIINETNNEKTDLINDLVSIIYSFSTRIYGLRKAKNKKEEILKIINN